MDQKVFHCKDWHCGNRGYRQSSTPMLFVGVFERTVPYELLVEVAFIEATPVSLQDIVHMRRPENATSTNNLEGTVRSNTPNKKRHKHHRGGTLTIYMVTTVPIFTMKHLLIHQLIHLLNKATFGNRVHLTTQILSDLHNLVNGARSRM